MQTHEAWGCILCCRYSFHLLSSSMGGRPASCHPCYGCPASGFRLLDSVHANLRLASCKQSCLLRFKQPCAT